MISLSKIFLDAKIQARTGYTGVLGFAVGMVAVHLLEESLLMNKQFQLNETSRSFLTHEFGKIIEGFMLDAKSCPFETVVSMFCFGYHPMKQTSISPLNGVMKASHRNNGCNDNLIARENCREFSPYPTGERFKYLERSKI